MATFAGSSARRRRERRLRMHLRHERLSVAMALAEALHHSSGAPKYDKGVVEEAQRGAVRGQTTATRAGGPATQYFTFGDEDVPAPGERLFWPQDRDLRRIPGHVEEPSLDVPALQMVEEVDDVSLALSALQEQVIVPATPEVLIASSVVRAVQPVSVELSLRLPGLDNVWWEDWTFHEYLEQVVPPDDPRELHIPADQRVQRSLSFLVRSVQDFLASGRWGEQVVDVPVRDRGPRAAVSGGFMEQVEDFPVRGRVPRAVVPERYVEQVADVPVPQHALSLVTAVSGRNVEQVVDAPVPQHALSSVTAVSGRNVEQVVDAPGRRADARSAAGSPTSWLAAASLEAPQERFHGVFRTFPRGEKSATSERQSSATLVPHSSSSTTPAYGTVTPGSMARLSGFGWSRLKGRTG